MSGRGMWIWVTAIAAAVALAAAGAFAAAFVFGSDGQYQSGWMWQDQQSWPDCTPPEASGTLVTFTASDMGAMGGYMMGGSGPMAFTPREAAVRAGSVTLRLVNAGYRSHELLIFSLPAGQQPGARTLSADDRVSEEGALGEAENVCPPDPDLHGTPPGGTAQLTLQLNPGRYEVICNLPGHYRHGMYALLTVT